MSEPGVDTDLIAVTTEMPMTPPTSSAVGVSDTPDFRSTLPDSNNINGLTIVLAVIAVLGGKAAWGFYENWSKRKHEAKMALLEKQSQRERNSKQNNETLEMLKSRLEEVCSDVDLLKKKNDSVGIGVSLDEVQSINERLEKLERSIKPKRNKIKI